MSAPAFTECWNAYIVFDGNSSSPPWWAMLSTRRWSHGFCAEAGAALSSRRISASVTRSKVRALYANLLRHEPDPHEPVEDVAAEAEREHGLERRRDHQQREADVRDGAGAGQIGDRAERGDRRAQRLREALRRAGDLLGLPEPRRGDTGGELRERAQGRPGQHP